MIHRHVFRVRRVLSDKSIPAVTEVDTMPCPVRPKEIGAVVLRAADTEVGVGRVDRYALELCRAKGGRVSISQPRHTRIDRLPNATIVARVNNRRIGWRDADKMAVHMQPIVAWRKRLAAISRIEKRPIQRANHIEVV